MKADFRTGAYTVRQLASKHKVSVGFVAKYTKDLGHDLKDAVNAGIQYRQAIATDNEQVVNAVSTVVDEATKHLLFFKNSALKNQSIANRKLSDSASMAELDAHSRLTAKNKETVLGRTAPDVQVNTQNNQVVLIDAPDA